MCFICLKFSSVTSPVCPDLPASWQGDGEEGTVGVLAVNDADEFGKLVGILGLEVVVFVDVSLEVVEEGVALAHHKFPVALPYADDLRATVAHLPIEEVVLLLLAGLAKHRRAEGDAVCLTLFPAPWRGGQAMRCDFLLGEGSAVLHKGGHEVVEGQLVIADGSLGDASAPTDEGDADAALVGTALDAAQFPVPAKERGVCATLFMRAVVAGEDDQGILVKAFLFELLQNLAHIAVQTCYHGSELCVFVAASVVPTASIGAVGTFLVGRELPVVAVQDAVAGLPELGMGQGVGEDAKKGLVLSLTVKPLEGIAMNQLSGVLPAPFIARAAGVDGRMQDVLLHHLSHQMSVSPAFGVVAVQEVRIIGVCLELADGTVEAVDAPKVGQRAGRALAALAGIRIAVGQFGIGVGIVVVPVSTRPLAEHAGAVAFLFEEFGNDGVCHVVGLLSDDVVVCIVSEHVLPEHRTPPVFLVATNLGMPRMLPRHEGAAAGGTHGTACVSLCEAHAFARHTVDARRRDELLAIAPQIAIAHVVAHYIYYIGVMGLGGHRKGQRAKEECPTNHFKGKFWFAVLHFIPVT